MVDSIDDIANQARQGSVSAIIQILNQKLADVGVRTRAILSNGVLQLLCEAPRPDQLEQPILVPQICQILESIQPRGIRRVSINSRIVREQQLLWLDEINRDPDSQLLWSEQITLKKPNPLKRFLEDWKLGRSQAAKTIKPTATSGRSIREKRQFRRGIIGGTSLSLLVLLAGWGIYEWLGEQTETQTQATPTQPPAADATLTANADAPPSPIATSATPTATPSSDPFVQAVRMAERAVADGQTAQSPADWLDLASRWQRASDLMRQVPVQDERYTTAQSRIQLYRQNSEAALQQAQRSQSPTTTGQSSN